MWSQVLHSPELRDAPSALVYMCVRSNAWAWVVNLAFMHVAEKNTRPRTQAQSSHHRSDGDETKGHPGTGSRTTIDLRAVGSATGCSEHDSQEPLAAKRCGWPR